MKEFISKDIEGTWLLSSMKVINSNGQTMEMYGENPSGITMFDSNGYMNAQMGSSSRLFFDSDVINLGTTQEMTEAFKTYMAFYGRFREESPGTLLIRLEDCLFPNWKGKEIIRYAEVTNNQLFLTTPPTNLGIDSAIVKAIWRRP